MKISTKILILAFFLVEISHGIETLDKISEESNILNLNKTLNEQDMLKINRSKRSLYYRNDNLLAKQDRLRRLRLARNPVFGMFGRYSRAFTDILGLGSPYNYGGFRRYPDYDDYYGYDTYDAYGPYGYDYYENSHKNYYRKPKKPIPNRPKLSQNQLRPTKENHHVGIKLSNRLKEFKNSVKSNISIDKNIPNSDVNKLSSLLNQIDPSNSSSIIRKDSSVNKSNEKTPISNNLKKVKIPSHLVEMKFPSIEKLASRIVSSLDGSTSSESKKKLVTTTSPSKTYKSYNTNSNMLKFQTSTRASISNGLKKEKISSSLVEKKFPKIDKLASRIVSHFI